MIADYTSFWPFYVGEHSRRGTRHLHTVGTGLGLVCHLGLVPLTQNLVWIPVGFLVGYALAWVSHGLVEHNRPATLRHPYWSFFGDLEMFSLMVLGWMDRELARLAGDRAREVTAGRQASRVLLRVGVFGYLGLLGVLWATGWLHIRLAWA